MDAIEELLGQCLQEKASDLFVTVGKPPAFRINGALVTPEGPPLEADTLMTFLRHALPVNLLERFLAEGELDVGYSPPALASARFRLNLHRQRGQLAMVARALPGGHLELAPLGLPPVVAELALLPRGLVLVTGATGSGKSTTMAAMIHQLNRQRRVHIVTVEDPIEFLHEDRCARITQREVGPDTRSFAAALRTVVRESPDVIVIGEMRDAETVEVAVAAAMTGHLVLSTLHTIDATQSLQRLLGLFPEARRQQLYLDLSLCLQGIVSQRLLPRASGEGRVLACEVLRITPASAQLLREGRIDELTDFMRTARDPSIVTFNQSLVQLYRSGAIDLDTGLAYSNNPDEFRLAAVGMRTGVDGLGGEEDQHAMFRSDMQALLELALEQGASDVHLSVGRPPIFRVGGRLHRIGEEPLGPGDVRWLLFSILSGRQRSHFELEKELDFSLRLESGARFRVNAYYQRGHMAVALRSIASRIPTPEELHLPRALTGLLERTQGLILVVGPTGSGKTTTVASLVEQINQQRACHILTIEDPIEYSYSSAQATIDQREVYSDTKSFLHALKYILRQDPDVIVVGEMRDQETIAAVLTAAETGHLVFATLHTNDSATTIDRIVDVFPSHQQAQIRLQLAACLLAVVSQRLVTCKEGEERVAAFELLLANNPVRALIREGKTHQIGNVLSTSSGIGMVTLDRSLQELVQKGLVEANEAARYMTMPDTVRKPLAAAPPTLAEEPPPANPPSLPSKKSWFQR